MKKLMSVLSAVFLMLLITNVCIPTLVYGTASGEGSGTILWDSLVIKADPGLTIVYDKYSSFVWAQASTYASPIYQETWDPVSAQGQVAGQGYSSQAFSETRTGLSQDLYSEASVMSDGDFEYARTGAERAAIFHVIGSGNIEIDIDYHFDFLLAGTTATDKMSGFQGGYIQLFSNIRYALTPNQRVTDYLSKSIDGIDSYADSRDFRLVNIQSFNDGEEGQFSIRLFNEFYANMPVSVPEPATMLLLGLGLVGLTGVRRSMCK